MKILRRQESQFHLVARVIYIYEKFIRAVANGILKREMLIRRCSFFFPLFRLRIHRVFQTWSEIHDGNFRLKLDN